MLFAPVGIMEAEEATDVELAGVVVERSAAEAAELELGADADRTLLATGAARCQRAVATMNCCKQAGLRSCADARPGRDSTIKY